MPQFRHQIIFGNIHLLIATWLEDHPLGRVFLSPFDVVFSRFDVVEPDLLYLSKERAAQALTPMNVQGVPELVIEIGSPSTRKRDETIKQRLYERSGVSEYWVVDPELDVVRVYRRFGEGFARADRAVARGRRRVDDAACFPVSSCRWPVSSANSIQFERRPTVHRLRDRPRITGARPNQLARGVDSSIAWASHPTVRPSANSTTGA